MGAENSDTSSGEGVFVRKASEQAGGRSMERSGPEGSSERGRDVEPSRKESSARHSGGTTEMPEQSEVLGGPDSDKGADREPQDGEGSEESESPILGVGGTSLAGDDEADEDSSRPAAGGKGTTPLKAIGGAAAVPAAGAAVQVLAIAALLNFLKNLIMGAIAAAVNLWNTILGGIIAVGQTVVGAITAVGGFVSGLVGGAVGAIAAGVTTVVAGVGVVTVAVAGTVASVNEANSVAMRDTLVVDCSVTATQALDRIDGSDGDVDQKTLDNAKTIYSVLAAWGMPDENIAGILGNWEAESGIDPTSVQGYFDSPQVMSDEKREAATNTDNGIGLGQWTFGRNTKLREYAQAHGRDWWTLEIQLGFMISASEGGNADIVKDMITTPLGNPATAATHFHDEWERSADTEQMKSRRATMAEKWMALFSGWTKNQALADSILEQAGTTVTGANSARAAAVRDDCSEVGAARTTLKEGGLTLEEATSLMEVYKSEGEEFLQSRYPGSAGPGDCGFGKADNCVGFTTYFMNKFTSFQEYALGNGIDQARSIASATGKSLSSTPTVYSVASGPGTGPAGHTFVVLGIQGDQAVIGEAACGTNHELTRARLMSIDELTSGVWEFVDVSDLLLDEAAVA